MTSTRWLLVAFVGDGCAGIFIAFMRMAGDLSEQSDTWPRGWIGNDLIRLPGRKEPFCSFRCRDPFVDANHLSQTDDEDLRFESQYFERGGQQSGLEKAHVN
jgi:hypothetical protein